VTSNFGHLRALTCSPSGQVHPLPLLGTGLDSFAYNASRTATVAGWATATPNGPQHAVVWPNQGGPVDLGVLPGDGLSRFFGIGENGVAVGNSGNAAGSRFRAIYWPGHGPLEMLPPLGARTNSSNALYATSDDEVLGCTTPPTGYDVPTLWEHASRLAFVGVGFGCRGDSSRFRNPLAVAAVAGRHPNAAWRTPMRTKRRTVA
jgi:hypothetical protein